MRKIIVGVDGSEHGNEALRWADREAQLHGAALTAVYAWQLPSSTGSPWVMNLPDVEQLEKGAAQFLDGALEAEDTSGLAEPVRRVAVHAGAARAMLDAAEGASLVVVGSRGLGGFAGLLLGSVSQQTARHAPCPVVVVRDAH